MGIKPLLDGAISIVDIKRKEKFTKKSFKLYASYKDVEELKRKETEGFFITSYFDNSFEVKKNQAINYKNQEIGFVEFVKFDEKKSKVKMFIYSKYKNISLKE